jgi:lipoprotein-releasing system permease protein
MLFLAIKYLFARKKQTLLTFLGIFFGTTAFVGISGFFLGFRGYLIEQLVNNTAHVHIESREDFITEHLLDESFYGKSFEHIFWSSPPSGRKDEDMVENPSQWYQRLAADPRVVAYSAQLTAAVILSKGKARISSTLVGCEPLQQVKVTNIADYMTEGRFKDLASGGNRIVIGIELMKKLGVRVSQNVFVSLARSLPLPFKVVGIFKTGNKQADLVAYGAITDVQRVNHTPNQVNEIAVKLTDFDLAKNLALSWSKISPEKIESWDQQNENIFNIFKLQDAIRYLTIMTILTVASFGIYNVLNMTVMQKRRDVAILRSIGFDNKEIIILFFSQGLILGLAGAILGLLAGYLLCLYLQTVPFGGGPMGGAGYLHISLDIMIYVYAFFFALISTTLASVLPARAAGKLTPIDIIRSGTE